MTGSKIAEQWSRLFALKSFDGDKRLVFTPESYGTEGRNILSGVMRDLNMGQNFLYDEVYNALEAIAESGLEAVRDEPWAYYVVDAYTSDLMAWLAAHCGHVCYLDDVVREGHARDGAQALMQAQEAAMQEIWMAVASAVQNELDELDLFSEGE